MGRTISRCLLTCALGISALTASPASASVIQHTVTPASDASLPGVDITVAQRPDGSFLFTLTAQPTSHQVYPPRVTARPGATPVVALWLNVDAQPLVAHVVVSARDMQTTVITVMRDYGVVGHHYTIAAAAWLP